MIAASLQLLPSLVAFPVELDQAQTKRTRLRNPGRHVDGAADRLSYMEVTPLKLLACPEDIQVVEVDAHAQFTLYELAVQTRGEVYAIAEELDSVDFVLSELDAEYQQVGLRRYRRAWLALDRESGRSLGALIANRGPTGSSFGRMENRADLILSEHVEDEGVEDIVIQLISAAAETYDDFPPGVIPVVADDRAARVLWLRGDQHVDAFFGEAGRPTEVVERGVAV
jgi:hypothetical protein